MTLNEGQLLCFLGVIMFVACTFQKAHYGRHFSNNGIKEPFVPASIGWLIMESPNLWLPLVYFLQHHQTSNVFVLFETIQTKMSVANAVLLSCYLLHYIHRDLIFPWIIRNNKTNPMPISVMLLAFGFCTCNSWTQARSLIGGEQRSIDWCFQPQFLVGVLLFVVGAVINIQSDYILLALRSKSTTPKAKATTAEKSAKKYEIPTGGFFEYVSCANYFGEMVEWLGFAVACDSWAGLGFFVCTVANLLPRALQHHEWYQQKFENYPKQRKAVFPFLL